MFQKVQTTLYTFPGQSTDMRHSFLVKPYIQVRFGGTRSLDPGGQDRFSRAPLREGGGSLNAFTPSTFLGK